MDEATGEAEGSGLRVAFDRRLKLEFHGATVTSDAGLLAFRELDDALGLTAMAAEVLADPRTGRNGRHSLIAQLRQSVFGRLAGYEDVNDADRLGRDAAMRWVVGGRAVTDQGASTSQMGRFETRAMTSPTNLTALADLSGRWIDRAQVRRARTALVLDIDSSVSPTYGAQEGTAYNGHFECTCYHPLFVFNQDGDLERCALRAGNVHSAYGWRDVLAPVVTRYRGQASVDCCVGMQPSPCRTCTSTWKRRGSSTPFVSRPIGCSRSGSRRCSGDPSAADRTPCGASTRAFAIGRRVGTGSAGSWRRSSGILASCIRASVSS